MMQTAVETATAPRAPMQGAGAVPPSFTEDAFLDGRLRILQPEKGYRAGIDAVFLAAAIPVKAGEQVFEAGIGAGVVALCLTHRNPGIHVTGIEIAQRYQMMCEENAKRNGFGTHIKAIHGDVKDAMRRDLSHMPQHGSFAHAFANPPFFEEGTVTPSPSLLKAQAHAFGPDDLDLWVKVMHAMVGLRGTVTLIHRADSLPKILRAMDERLGDIRVAPLFARTGTVASRVIVQGVKGSKAPLQMLPGLVLHNEDNSFTTEAEAVLRHGMACPLK
jgi:tRNA1(Val) A37 N6-methylase TrmN6